MKKTLLIIGIALTIFGCKKKDDPSPTTTVVDYTSKFVGTFLVHDTGYYNVTASPLYGGGNPCNTTRIINKTHLSKITKTDQFISKGDGKGNTIKEFRQILISNYFDNGITKDVVEAYIGISGLEDDHFNITLPAIKLLKASCFQCSGDYTLDDSISSGYYVNVCSGIRAIGTVSPDGKKIIVDYSNNNSASCGAWIMNINNRVTSTFVRQ